MEDMKIVTSLEDSGLSLKGVSETSHNEAIEQKGGFFSMLLGTLGASFVGSMLTGKEINRAGERITRAGYGSKGSSVKKKLLIPPPPLTNFEVQKYYQNEPILNGVYYRDNLPYKIKDEAYIINLDEYSDIGTHWITLYSNNYNNVTYFDTFGVEHIPKEIKNIIERYIIGKIIFKIQAYDSVMCGYF